MTDTVDQDHDDHIPTAIFYCYGDDDCHLLDPKTVEEHQQFHAERKERSS
jgi:hypothetical protein